MKRDFNLEKRKYVLGGSVVLVVLVFLVRLFMLQIIKRTDLFGKMILFPAKM